MTPEETVADILPGEGEQVRGRIVALIRGAYIRGQNSIKAAAGPKPPEIWVIGGSLLKAFLTSLVGILATKYGISGASGTNIDPNVVVDAATLAQAVAAAAIHTVFNFVNPTDKRYGISSHKEAV